jgi:hypothetical protein
MPTTATQPFWRPQPDIVVAERSSPAYQAYQVLHFGFVVLPVLVGLDKFASWLTNWDVYLAPRIAQAVPITTHQLMMAVGVVEIVAGLIVALKPRIGGLIVAVWLAAIIVNLLVMQTYYDVALRDFGLLLGALALSRLSIDFDRAPTATRR